MSYLERRDPSSDGVDVFATFLCGFYEGASVWLNEGEFRSLYRGRYVYALKVSRKLRVCACNDGSRTTSEGDRQSVSTYGGHISRVSYLSQPGEDFEEKK